MSNEKVFSLISIITSIITMIAVVALFLVNESEEDKPEINIPKQMQREFPKILETIFEEGYGKVSIDYNDLVLNQREIYITTDLDEKKATEIMYKLKYLEYLDKEEEINLYINTSGGSSGIMLSNYIQTIKPPVNTIALDFCASSGSEVLASGTGIRKAYSTSRIIPHIVTVEDYSIDDENFSYSKLQNIVNIEFWGKYSNLPEEFYNRETEVYYNFTSKDALKYGLIDEIIE